MDLKRGASTSRRKIPGPLSRNSYIIPALSARRRHPPLPTSDSKNILMISLCCFIYVSLLPVRGTSRLSLDLIMYLFYSPDDSDEYLHHAHSAVLFDLADTQSTSVLTSIHACAGFRSWYFPTGPRTVKCLRRVIRCFCRQI